MSARTRVSTIAALGAAIGCGAVASRAEAQALAQRVASAPDGRVQFAYASRDGACGDGRTFMRVSFGSSTSSEYYGSWSGDMANQTCTRGPVRLVLETAANTVVGMRVYVGPLTPAEGVTDLGMVRARDAADYLMSLAARAEGSVSRDAIMPAMLADSANNQPALLALMRDQTRSRETRRSAISWYGRVAPAAAAQPLLAIVMDENDNQSVRQQALRTLSRLDGGAGIPEVIRLANDRAGGWVAREALGALAQSGDPRAREHLRQVVRRAELPDDALATAIRSFGQQYATASDIQLIRESWTKLPGTKSQNAALSAITEFGGADNARFLLSLARDPAATASARQSALRGAVRSGARIADLVAMYNATIDYQMKDAIINALGESGDKEAVDKLLSIAKGDDSINARKKAINVLARSSDPRVKRELEALLDRR